MSRESTCHADELVMLTRRGSEPQCASFQLRSTRIRDKSEIIWTQEGGRAAWVQQIAAGKVGKHLLQSVVQVVLRAGIQALSGMPVDAFQQVCACCQSHVIEVLAESATASTAEYPKTETE